LCGWVVTVKGFVGSKSLKVAQLDVKLEFLEFFTDTEDEEDTSNDDTG